MSKVRLKYFTPHPIPTIKIKQDGFNFFISSIALKRKYDNLFHQVIKEIMDNDGLEEIETRMQYAKSFKYDERYINVDDLRTYFVDIFKENGFEVKFEYDNK
jgi:c-di-AMP phosphodiesterase-like protein